MERDINRPQFKSWKQPIPSATELQRTFGNNHRCMQLYKELIYRANNADERVLTLETKRGGTKSVVLKRGQVLYGRNRFGEYLCWNPKTTDRALVKLEKLYKLVTLDRTHDFTIVTIVNYETVIGMSNYDSNQRPTRDHETTTSENVKSVDIKNSVIGLRQSSEYSNNFGDKKTFSYKKNKFGFNGRTAVDGGNLV